MCKTNQFINLQNAMLSKATELGLPDNIINSISYSICMADLWYVIQSVDDRALKEWFLDNHQRLNLQSNS